MIMTMMRGTINIKMKSFPKSLAEESYTGATYVDSPKPSPLKTGLVALLETAAVLLLSICKPEHIYGFKNVCTFLLPVTGHVMWLSGNFRLDTGYEGMTLHNLLFELRFLRASSQRNKYMFSSEICSSNTNLSYNKSST